MNCMLAAPDGSRLCTLDRKKADWYIEKGIGRSILTLFSLNWIFKISQLLFKSALHVQHVCNCCVLQGFKPSTFSTVSLQYFFPLVKKRRNAWSVWSNLLIFRPIFMSRAGSKNQDSDVLVNKLRFLDLIRSISLVIYMLEFTARLEEVRLVSMVNLLRIKLFCWALTCSSCFTIL